MRRRIAAAALVVLAGLCLTLWLGVRAAAPGAVLRVVAVGQDPVMVVVDGTTRRAFVVANGADRVDVLDARTGALVRAVQAGQRPQQAVVDARDGHVFVVAGDGTVATLDARSGRLIRSVTLHRDAYGVVDAIAGPAVLDAATGRLFIGITVRDVNAVAMLDARSGRVVRITGNLEPANPQLDGSGEVVDVDRGSGRVFAASVAGGVVSVLDGRSGVLLRTMPLSGAAALAARSTGLATASGAQPSDGMVPGGPVTGASPFAEVGILDRHNGVALRTLATVMAAGAVALDRRRHATYRATLAGVQVVDSANGRLLRTIALQGGCIGVAVDAASGHVFALSPGSSSDVPGLGAWIPPWLRARLPWLPPATTTRIVPARVTILDPTR